MCICSCSFLFINPKLFYCIFFLSSPAEGGGYVVLSMSVRLSVCPKPKLTSDTEQNFMKLRHNSCLLGVIQQPSETDSSSKEIPRIRLVIM